MPPDRPGVDTLFSMAISKAPPKPGSDRRSLRIEHMAPEIVEVLRAKSGTERMQIAFGMFRAAQRMVASQLRAEHPDWDDEAVQREVARRIASGSG
jgi:hypothetical protein